MSLKFQCKVSSIGKFLWTLAPQVLAWFEEAVEPMGDGAQMEEMYQWDVPSNLYLTLALD